MGRRGRGRSRARGQAPAPARKRPTAPAAKAAEAAPARPPREPLRKLLHWLNPRKPRSRARARFGAVLFGVLTLMIAGTAWANHRPALYRPAVLLAILTVLWSVQAATMREDPEP
ncbi:MAG TPA: hypothetical protein VF486_21685 [Actinomycetes bacterium]